MLGDKYPEDKRLVFDMITEQFDEWAVFRGII